MPKENKVKSLKEKQHDRNLRQQHAKVTDQNNKEREIKNRRRKQHNVKIIFAAVCLIALVVTSYGILQYYEGQKPPTIGDSTVNPNSDNNNTAVNTDSETEPFIGGSASDFTYRDINGDTITLSQLKGKVIGIHFMSVGCGGNIDQINDYQLQQLKSVCDSFCTNKSAVLLTVAVATCENSKLDQIRINYNVTWALGNDYDDNVLDIVNSYVPQGVGDGSVVLIDKTFNITKIYRGGVAAETLTSTISQLLEA